MQGRTFAKFRKAAKQRAIRQQLLPGKARLATKERKLQETIFSRLAHRTTFSRNNHPVLSFVPSARFAPPFVQQQKSRLVTVLYLIFGWEIFPKTKQTVEGRPPSRLV